MNMGFTKERKDKKTESIFKKQREKEVSPIIRKFCVT